MALKNNDICHNVVRKALGIKKLNILVIKKVYILPIILSNLSAV